MIPCERAAAHVWAVLQSALFVVFNILLVMQAILLSGKVGKPWNKIDPLKRSGSATAGFFKNENNRTQIMKIIMKDI
jgi:hypothetical protein